jgi:hypothetical protein
LVSIATLTVEGPARQPGGSDGRAHERFHNGGITRTILTGHTYTTKPGSALQFPTLCLPTGELSLPEHHRAVELEGHGKMMPKRRRTRTENLQRRIEAERRLNDDHVTDRNKPPPF